MTTTSPGVNVTILDLPDATLPLTGDEYLELVQNDTAGTPQSVRVTVTDLLAALAARVTVLEA